MSNPAYRAGYVDGAMAREPVPERYEDFAGFYDYQLGHKDACQDLLEGYRDPALVVADYGWMVTEETRRRNLNNIILTGAPRSGTTLACHLLNKLPDALALHEPIRPARFVDPEAGPDMVLAAMERFFNEQRQQAREQGTVASKGVGGVVPDDPYEPDPEPGARIRFQKVRGDEFGESPYVERR